MPSRPTKPSSSHPEPQLARRTVNVRDRSAPTTVAANPTKPKTCTCKAYRWPHRPGGGLCCWPDPPLKTCQTPAGTNRPVMTRRRGERARLMREYGLHPIRDRALINRVMRQLYLRPGISLANALARADHEVEDPPY